MSNFSIILLREGDIGVKQYHFGTKLIFFILILILAGFSFLGWKFFEQFKVLENQSQLCFLEVKDVEQKLHVH